MAARIRELRDLLVAAIKAFWEPKAPDEVFSAYTYDVRDKDLKGRKVWVIPEASAGGPLTRGEDANDYSFQIWVIERYEEQDAPPESWVDERIDFTAALEDLLGNPRAVPYLTGVSTGVYPQEAGIDPIFDVVDLFENKMFISVLTLLLREDADATVGG